MAFLSENEGTTRTLLHHVLETQPLSSPVSSNTRQSKRSLSTSMGHPRRNLRDPPSRTLLSKQTKTVPAQPKDTGADGQLFVEHYDFLEEGTPRILLKKILQTASEASVLVPSLMNSQEPEPVELQEESKWNSLELQLPELEPSVTVAPGLLMHNRKKRCLRVSEFEQEVDQGLAVASDLTERQPASANKSSVTRSFNLTLATVRPPESIERPGLARRPPNRKAIDVEAFEQRLKDIPLTPLPDRCTYHRATPVDGDRSFQASPDSIGLRRSLAKGQELKAVTQQANQRMEKGPRKQTKSGTKSPSQNTPLSTSSLSAGTRSRPWTGTSSQNSCFSARSLPARSSISREARAKSGVAHQVEEEEERLMDEEARESEEDTEILQSTVVSELSMKTPEFLRAKRYHSLLQPTSPVPPNTNTTLLPSKLTQAKRAPKRRAPGPRQPRDPDKVGLNNYCKVFSFYAKTPMEKSASETLMKCLNQYFRTLCDDLETFAHHAGRKTVLLADLELLMRRQGLVTDDISLYVLVERYLPLEYRRLLIPCAASGNAVFPAG
ncbi:centromere protein T isoform X1 [Phascolarctos cinereus]|uniref:Centromere protein T n=1 Tax=Phascolarctos cinereus TaxID=38626 RepID=A0A6P5KH84_PHACI|nr:centromere protein T isoform X1 [Phascolarctos cinereus]XP_020844984.1 centromere protein T isoform X1 [Phascolarctos cinereus]XP_020844985.1 centromere protein T isoform X1 [Phascolarctos cinereus]